MKAPFEKHMLGADAPALGALAIVPDDDTDLSAEIRAMTICGAARE